MGEDDNDDARELQIVLQEHSRSCVGTSRESETSQK
jgi:hypothetical protein